LGRAADAALASLRRPHPPADPAAWKDEYYFAIRHQGYLNRLNYYKMQTIPMRNPLLDRRVLDFVRTVPGPERRSKRLFKGVVTGILAPVGDIPFAARTSLIPWGRVAAADEKLRSFFGDHLLSLPGMFPQLFDPEGIRLQVDEWLSGSSPSDEPEEPKEPSGPGARRRLRLFLKRMAYSSATPAPLRRRLVPQVSYRRPFTYSFRLLTLALYSRRLEAVGIRMGPR
jgi:hypothetical protein